MWLAVWPGVVTASSVQPSPLTISPSRKRDVRPEVVSPLAFERIVLTDMQRPRRAVRAFGQNRRAGRRLDRRHRRRMVAVGVRDENMRDRLAAHRIEQRGDVSGVVRDPDR